jgi:DeoR/GlpR family transcriptional regulator of sugar metabolism
MKKQSDSRGVIRKKEILNFIKSNSSEDWMGVHVNEIVKHMSISRMAVTKHLNQLVSEDEIRKTKRGAYLPKEIFNDLIYMTAGHILKII